MQDIKGVMKPLKDSQLCLDKLREAHAAGTLMLLVNFVIAVHFVHAVSFVHAVHADYLCCLALTMLSRTIASHSFMFEASCCTKRLFHEI